MKRKRALFPASPPVGGAVNVFMKKLSPESERLSPLRRLSCK